jgi:hypothetical protein
MAPMKLEDASVNPSDLSDEESYIEEEVLDSEEELIEEMVEEEIIEEEVVTDDDMEDSDVGSDGYMDDDSSTPPLSLADSDGPVVEGYAFHATRASSAEITEEARKAKTGDEVEKEKSVGRQAARDALLRETQLQEKTLKAMEQVKLGGPDGEEIRIQKQQLVARRRLVEEIEKMDIKKSKKKRGIASDQPPPSTADLEKRKKGLAELRRHAAFQELARDNTKLKAEKAARSVASASTNNSIGQPLDSLGLNEIKAVEISYEQVPVSPLRAKEDPSQTNESVSQTFALPPSSRKLTSSQSQTSNGSGRIKKENAGQRAGSEHKSPSTCSSRSSLTKKNVDPESIPTLFRASDLLKAATENTMPVVRVDGEFYPLADLQAKRVEGIDNTGREQYLSPEDFLATFSMTKEEFVKLPKWKRDKAKTSLKLF